MKDGKIDSLAGADGTDFYRNKAQATAATPSPASEASPDETGESRKAEEQTESSKKETQAKSADGKKEEEKYTGMTLAELYGLASIGAKKIGFDVDFEDKAQRDVLVQKREEDPGPWNCGFIGFILRILFAIPAAMFTSATLAEILPAHRVVPEGIPVSIPPKIFNQDVATIQMGDTSCKVSRKHLVCAHPMEQTMYYDKVRFNGKELSYGRIKAELEKEYDVNSSAKVISMLVDLAMHGASNEKTVGNKLLQEKIESYHYDAVSTSSWELRAKAEAQSADQPQAEAPHKTEPAPAAQEQEQFVIAPTEQELAPRRETEAELDASLGTLLKANMEAAKASPPQQSYASPSMSSDDEDSVAPRA